MSNSMFDKILKHYGHNIVIAKYGRQPDCDDGSHPVNAAIECEDCGEVIYDEDYTDNKPLSHCYYRIAFRCLNKGAMNKGADGLGGNTIFELVSLDELKKGDIFVLARVINLGGRELLTHEWIGNDPPWCVYRMIDDYPTEGLMRLPYAPLMGKLPAECWKTCEAVFNETEHY